MQIIQKKSSKVNQHHLEVSFTHNKRQVKEAQKLRYKIFSSEYGTNHGNYHLIDKDIFDPFCEHIIVRDLKNDNVVGTYRLLTPHKAAKIGGFYSEDEFDLVRLNNIKNQCVEIGRACVDPSYRSGFTISLLWSAILKFVIKNNYSFIIGSASVPLLDGGLTARYVEKKLNPNTTPAEYLVRARHPLPENNNKDSQILTIPPLIKAYLRIGAYLCSEANWDHNFNSADFFMLLNVNNMNKKYFRRFSSS